MRLLELECTPAETDFVIAELYEHGVLGVAAEDMPDGRTVIRGYFNFQIETGALARHAPRWLPVPEEDWEEVARSQWEPLLVGSRFFLVPEWRDDPTPPGRLRLLMRPGRACGTGWGPATHLPLEMMETLVRSGDAVLDIGTGSGILAVAACLLGATRVIGCDIEHEATEIAAARFRQENVPAAAFTGSVRSVRSASIDLVLANLNAATLLDLEPEIQRVRKPGSRAILGGFRERDLDRVRRAFNCRAEPRDKDGWLALVC